MPHLWKTIALNLTGLAGRTLERLNPNEIEWIARTTFERGKPRSRAALDLFAKATHDLSATPVNSFRINGEALLIERTGRFGFKTIFDVGANIGDWTSCAYDHHPAAIIHCFEILPSTFAVLANGLGARIDRCVLNRFGLSDHAGKIEVYFGSDPYVSSVYEFLTNETRHTTSCLVRQGDTYARENGIESIDFLKIDVEGAESGVIKGLEGLIGRKAVRLVQFEYNRGAIVSRFLLLDFYEFFAKRGYILGKLTPRGVLFRDYQYAYEDFNGPNYVACLRDDRELQQAIVQPA